MFLPWGDLCSTQFGCSACLKWHSTIWTAGDLYQLRLWSLTRITLSKTVLWKSSFPSATSCIAHCHAGTNYFILDLDRLAQSESQGLFCPCMYGVWVWRLWFTLYGISHVQKFLVGSRERISNTITDWNRYRSEEIKVKVRPKKTLRRRRNPIAGSALGDILSLSF